jgi:hypothetical protein
MKTLNTVKIIALWRLLISIVNIGFLILFQFGLVGERINASELCSFFFSTIGNLMLFICLWRFSPLGWKSTIVFIPISWSFVIINLYIEHETGVGMLLSIFGFIDGAILKHLFNDEILRQFKISSTKWLRMKPMGNLFMILPVFFAAIEFLDPILATIVSIVLVFALNSIWRRLEKTDEAPTIDIR